MSKELPFFPFEPAEHLAGNIQLCTLQAQGLYANIKCIYWQRQCKMKRADLYKRYPDHHHLLDELINEQIIKTNNDEIVIEFLWEKFVELSIKSRINSKNGKKGAEAKKLKRQQSEPDIFEQAPGNEKSNEVPGCLFYIGMNQFKIPVSQYVLTEFQITIDQFMPTMNPITTEMVLKQMDTDCVGKRFTTIEHVRNTFQKIAREMKAGKTLKSKFAPAETVSKTKLDFS